MKLGMFTSGYQRYPLERAFMDAEQFGYDYIELWGGYPHAYAADMTLERIGEIEKWIQKYHMPVKCYTPEHNGYPFNYMDGDEIQWNRAMEYLEQAVGVAADIGAGKMLISAGHAGYEKSRKWIEKRLKMSLERIAAVGEQKQVTILLEPLTIYESNVVCSLNDLEEALRSVDSPRLAGMCDLAVPFTSGEPAAEYVRRLGNKMQHLHVIDNDGESDSHILPGDGRMPLREMLQEIQRAGYDGDATIELVTGYLKEPSVYAKIAIDRVRNMIENGEE